MPGAQCTRSLACKNKKHTSIVTTGSPGLPGIPARNGFNGFLCTLPGDRAFLPPSPAVCLRTLDASVGASGPHNFAVRVSAFRQPRRPRPLHPAPTSVTIAKRPLEERDGGGYIADLGEARTEIFLQTRLDRANQIELFQKIRR